MEKGYYRCVYFMLRFKNEVFVYINDEQADVKDDPDDKLMGDVILDNQREHHWRMVFEDNDRGVENAKAFLHAKRWDIYVNENMVNGGYLVEVVGHDKRKFIW